LFETHPEEACAEANELRDSNCATAPPTFSPTTGTTASPTFSPTVYLISSVVILTDVAPDAFNADPDAIAAFKIAVAAGLGIDVGDVFGVVAAESAGRRRLDDAGGTEIRYNVRLTLADLSASDENELLIEFKAVMIEATQPDGDFSTTFADEAETVPSLADAEVDADATAAAVEAATVATGSGPTGPETVIGTDAGGFGNPGWIVLWIGLGLLGGVLLESGRAKVMLNISGGDKPKQEAVVFQQTGDMQLTSQLPRGTMMMVAPAPATVRAPTVVGARGPFL